MEYHKIDKKELYLRTAMWKCYKKRCVYCGVALEVRHIQVDHILPEDESKIDFNDKQLNEYIKELKENGFEKNSIENYILSCSDCNNKKRNYVFSVSNMRFFHDLASRNSLKIYKEMKRMKMGESELPVKNTVQNFQNYSVADLYCHKSVYKLIGQIKFEYGLGDVRIDAYLPYSYDDSISCLISFKEIYQSHLFITYGEDDIINFMFTGYKTNIKENKRGWCTICENDSLKAYQIKLPNITFNCTYETLEQMAEICDSLYEEYLLQKININNILESDMFPQSSKDTFKLISLKNEIYILFQNYIENHQYDQDKNIETNIFHLQFNNPDFYIDTNINETGNKSIHAKIKVVKNGDYYDFFWKPGYSNSDMYDKMLDFDNVIKWTALYTYNKLVYDFIPAALQENYINNISFFKKLRNRKYKIIYNAEYLFDNNFVISYKNE